MRTWIKCGWRSTKEQTYILILLFLYRLLWGYFLYGFLRSAIVPLLLRYPAAEAGGTTMGRVLFYLEGRLRLEGSPDVRRWLLILALLLLTRLLISSFIRAGLLHELRQESLGERGLFFFPGMRKYGLPILLFSMAEWAFALLPLYWIIPQARGTLFAAYFDSSRLWGLLPLLAPWLLYLFILRLIWLYLEFGYVGGRVLSSLGHVLRYFIPAASLRLLIGAGGALTAALCAASGYLLPGLPALLIRQAAPLPATLFALWGIAAQYHHWRARQEGISD
ncbi:hypothetical protein [Paenibacillus glufosinatiresistens]|uniref:hypothetical protein n=1 Tax=Paenibacillus glufosinatiresistens TaxID=3070657 RepID=UPI00286DF79A|nr:hypothetical protein [Paenibacillus sp. YX.27]